MKLIFNKFDPKQSIYYNAALILKFLDKQVDYSFLYSKLLSKLKEYLKVELNLIILSIDWLILNGGISLFEKEGNKYVSK